MFGEVESQAMEALDLPGVFRTRSHSYVRAIQAGCSQDDDCLSVFSMSGPQGGIKGGAGECAHACAPAYQCVDRLGGESVGQPVGEGVFMSARACLPQQKQVYALTLTPAHKCVRHLTLLHAICAFIFNF